MSFSDNVKTLRKKRKWSQDDLARHSGVSQSAISAIELGDRSPSLETAALIAQALRVPLVDLLKDEKSPAAEGDEATKEELISLLTSLTPEEAQRVRDFVSGLLSSQSK